MDFNAIKQALVELEEEIYRFAEALADFVISYSEPVSDKEPLPRPARSGPRVSPGLGHMIPWFTSGFT